MNSVVTQRFINCHNYLKEHKLIPSSRQFAFALDYLPQSLSEIMKGRRDVPLEILRKAVEEFHMNPLYLFTGKGEMFIDEDYSGQIRTLTVMTDGEGDERIVHVPVPAQAGYAGEIMEPEILEELPTYSLPDEKFKHGTYRSFDISGDSMEPSLYEGDKVICQYIEPGQWNVMVKDDYVYVVVTRGDVVVKRVRNMLDDGYIELHSDNTFYDPYPVEGDNIKEIWQVHAKLSPFLHSSQSWYENYIEEIRNLQDTVVKQTEIIHELQSTLSELLKKQKVEHDAE